ncbi:MAG: hypothetical protein ACI89L_002184 [Phycisphaerales bacterium]|jgi:hypothetical protein
MSVRLSIRFPIDQIQKYASEYVYEDDSGVMEIGAVVRERGWLTFDELAAIAHWKSARITRHIQKNVPEDVTLITRAAFQLEADSARVLTLQALRGVGLPMASVLLHLCHPDPFPVIDYRALWSLRYEKEPPYSIPLWIEYVRVCRELAGQTGLSMRVLDRGLWQYSKVHQPAL